MSDRQDEHPELAQQTAVRMLDFLVEATQAHGLSTKDHCVIAGTLLGCIFAMSRIDAAGADKLMPSILGYARMQQAEFYRLNKRH